MLLWLANSQLLHVLLYEHIADILFAIRVAMGLSPKTPRPPSLPSHM
jgi:hypothetical protein